MVYGLIPFALIFSLFSHCSALVQTLVFGTDSSSSGSPYFCEINFSPYKLLSSATIFKVLNEKEDKAVPCSRVYATESSNANGYFRLEIPESLAVPKVGYSFQFEFADGSDAYSETWVWDKTKKTFALGSSVTPSLLDNPNVVGALCILGALAGVGAFYMINKRIRKSRQSL